MIYICYDRPSRNKTKSKKVGCYTWGGAGRQKRAERSGFALIFLFLFASRQKEKYKNCNMLDKGKIDKNLKRRIVLNDAYKNNNRHANKHAGYHKNITKSAIHAIQAQPLLLCSLPY